MSEKDDTSRLHSIDNNQCILVEFCNEKDEKDQNLLATGFVCWLSKDDELDIELIIKESIEVSIQWPINCDITSAATMKSKMRNVIFKQVSAKVLAVGEWTDMRRKHKNMLEFGLISPTREERRQLARKRACNESDGTKIFESKKPYLSLIQKNKDDQLLSLISQSSNENIEEIKLSYDSDSNDEVSDKDTVKEGDEVSDQYDDDDNEENGSELASLLQEKDKKIEIQKEEIKKVKEHNQLLQKELDQEKTEKQTFLKDKEELLKKFTCCKEEMEKMKTQNVQPFINDFHEIRKIIDQRLQKAVPYRKLADITNKSTKVTLIHEDLPDTNDSLKSENTMVSVKSDYENTDNDKASTSKGNPTEQKSVFKLKKSMLTNVRKSSVADYTNDILDVLFTRRELATHSVTGKQCQANKGMPPRPGLDPARLDAARNYCAKLFGNQKGWKTMFNYTARNKCGDYRKKGVQDTEDIEIEDD